MTKAPKSNASQNHSGTTLAASTRKSRLSNPTRPKPQRPTPKSARTLSHVSPLNLLDHPEPSDLKSVVRHYAERETEALALKTIQLAKKGHTGALTLIYESLKEREQDKSTLIQLDVGAITRLDEIADAQRIVIAAATEGQIKPSDAVQYMKMLNELGEAIKNSELQAEIDELRTYVHGA